jgi:hypothetical protein
LLSAVVLALKFFWPTAWAYLVHDPVFTFAQNIGVIFLVLSSVFNDKSRKDLRTEFEEFIQPFRLNTSSQTADEKLVLLTRPEPNESKEQFASRVKGILQERGVLASHRKFAEIDPDRLLSLARKIEVLCAKGAKQADPQFVVVAGGVGVGKSRFRKANYQKGWVFVDSGEVYREIKPMLATSSLDAENACMEFAGYGLLDKAISERRNILIEIVGNTIEPIQTIIKKMTEIGYRVDLRFIQNDNQKSWNNNLGRGKDNTSAYYTQDETLAWFRRYFGL